MKDPETNLVSKTSFDAYFSDAKVIAEDFEMSSGEKYLIACASRDYYLNSPSPLIEQAAYITLECALGKTSVRYTKESSVKLTGKYISCLLPDFTGVKFCPIPDNLFESLHRKTPIYTYFPNIIENRKIILYRYNTFPYEFICAGDAEVATLKSIDTTNKCIFSQQFEERVEVSYSSGFIKCKDGKLLENKGLFYEEINFVCNGLKAYTFSIEVMEIESNFICVKPDDKAFKVADTILSNEGSEERIVPNWDMGKLSMANPDTQIPVQCAKSNAEFYVIMNYKGKYINKSGFEIKNAEKECQVKCDLPPFPNLSGTIVSGESKMYYCNDETQFLNLTNKSYKNVSTLYQTIIIFCRSGETYLRDKNGDDLFTSIFSAECVSRPSDFCEPLGIKSMSELIIIPTIKALKPNEKN